MLLRPSINTYIHVFTYMFMYIPIQVLYRPCIMMYIPDTYMECSKSTKEKYTGVQTQTINLMHSIKLP